MKITKEKLEFWLHKDQKQALKQVSEKTGYSVAELLRKGIEYILNQYK